MDHRFVTFNLIKCEGPVLTEQILGCIILTPPNPEPASSLRIPTPPPPAHLDSQPNKWQLDLRAKPCEPYKLKWLLGKYHEFKPAKTSNIWWWRAMNSKHDERTKTQFNTDDERLVPYKTKWAKGQFQIFYPWQKPKGSWPVKSSRLDEPMQIHLMGDGARGMSQLRELERSESSGHISRSMLDMNDDPDMPYKLRWVLGKFKEFQPRKSVQLPNSNHTKVNTN